MDFPGGAHTGELYSIENMYFPLYEISNCNLYILQFHIKGHSGLYMKMAHPLCKSASCLVEFRLSVCVTDVCVRFCWCGLYPRVLLQYLTMLVPSIIQDLGIFYVFRNSDMLPIFSIFPIFSMFTISELLEISKT